MKHFMECFDMKGPDECWLWTQGLEGTGYGHKKINGVYYKAHRLVYEHIRGSIPHRMVLDHLCGVKHCVNPNHLEIVTPRINTLRGNGPTAIKFRAKQARLERLKDAKIF
jgi:hypothetical protein